MAINPLIGLGTKVPDLGGRIANFADQQNELSRLAQQDQAAGEEANFQRRRTINNDAVNQTLNDQRIRLGRDKIRQAGKESSAIDSAQDAARLLSLPDHQMLPFLEQRFQKLTQAAQDDPSITTTQTRQLMRMAQSGDFAGVRRESQREASLGVRLGFLPGAQQAKPGALQQKITTLESQLGRKLTQAELLRIGGGAPRGPLVTNVLGNVTEDRPLTEADASSFNLSPEQAANFVISDGKLRPIGTENLSPSEKIQEEAFAKREAGQIQGVDLVQQFEDSFNEAPTIVGVVPPGAERAVLAQQREALVAWVAKNILGTPGTEPSPKLNEIADKIVPDFSGAFDRSNFDEQIESLKQLMKAGGSKASTVLKFDESGNPIE